MAPHNNHDPANPSETKNTNVQEEDLREMEAVNQRLDALSCALDVFEQRTDDILSQLRELLDSNREIRRQLAEEKQATACAAPNPIVQLDKDEQLPEQSNN